MNNIRKQRIIKFIKFLAIKLPIIFGILALMMIASLKLVERYPEPLREGFQDYLSGAYNTNATIGRLEKILFFPMIIMNATDITMHNKSNAAVIDMEIKSITLRSPFWSMLLHAGRVNTFKIEGLKSNAGFILPQPVQIDDLDIIDRNGPEQYGSFIVATGLYNGQKMTFEAEIKKIKSSYKIEKEIPFSLEIGSAMLNALMIRKSNNVEIKNTVLSFGKKTSIAKNYVLFEDQKFTDGNPLYCIINSKNLHECDKYLTH